MMVSVDDEINSVSANFLGYHTMLPCQNETAVDKMSNITVHRTSLPNSHLVRARAVHLESTWVEGQGE